MKLSDAAEGHIVLCVCLHVKGDRCSVFFSFLFFSTQIYKCVCKTHKVHLLLSAVAGGHPLSCLLVCVCMCFCTYAGDDVLVDYMGSAICV